MPNLFQPGVEVVDFLGGGELHRRQHRHHFLLLGEQRGRVTTASFDRHVDDVVEAPDYRLLIGEVVL